MSVWDYWTFIVDSEQFFDDYFERYDLDYKKLKAEDLKEIIENIAPKEENSILGNLIKNNKQDIQNLSENFHITIWKFMYAMRLSYEDVINMPLSVFFKFLEDLEYIVWDKEKKTSSNNNFSWKPEKDKLKKLFSKQ